MKKVLFFFFFLTAWSLYSEAQVANEDKHRHKSGWMTQIKQLKFQR